MQIRFERKNQGYEIGCDCGTEFVAPYGSSEATCPKCGAHTMMSGLFDDWWREEPTAGRFAYREA